MRIDVAKVVERHSLLRELGEQSQGVLFKQDIPSVQAEITAIAPLVEKIWATGAESALQDLLTQAEFLATLSDSQFDQDFVVAALASVLLRFDQTTLDSVIVLGAAQRLLVEGANSTGLEFDMLSAEFFMLQVRVAEDLHFWLRHRFRQRAPQIEEVIRVWFSLPRESRRNSLNDLMVDVARVIEDPEGVVSNLVVDLWGYRSFNAGVVLAAAGAGVETLVVFNNPPGGGPDQKTTSFCRKVHGRRFRTVELAEKFEGYYEAQANNDLERTRATLPLLSKEESELRKGSVEALIDRKGLGPPPYHMRCRTVLQVG